jgi:hypothetical protein
MRKRPSLENEHSGGFLPSVWPTCTKLPTARPLV